MMQLFDNITRIVQLGMSEIRRRVLLTGYTGHTPRSLKGRRRLPGGMHATLKCLLWPAVLGSPHVGTEGEHEWGPRGVAAAFKVVWGDHRFY